MTKIAKGKFLIRGIEEREKEDNQGNENEIENEVTGPVKKGLKRRRKKI